MKKLFVTCALLAAAIGCNKKKEEAPPPAPTPTPEAPKTVEKPPKAPEAPAPDPKLVERGAYIAKAGACVVCHTAMGPMGPDVEHAFAGGLEMPDPMGTWRTPNITQDKGSGIGSWTDDQIGRAIREGVRPDGKGLYAIMPFMNFAALSDDDTKALVAFLRTIKPIEKVIAPNKDLKMPQGPMPEPAMAPIKALRADATSADPVKHGGYMATVMLCNHCHWTPGKDFAPAGPDKMFSGGLPFELAMLGKGKLFARNITSDPETGIGKWTEDQIFTAIKTMTKPDGKTIQGPMLFMQGQWSTLEQKDLHDVAAFIHKLPPVKNKVAASNFTPNPPPGGAPPAGGDKPGDKPGDKKPDDKKPDDKKGAKKAG
jgi:mono/diheme cytochrome c family protein